MQILTPDDNHPLEIEFEFDSKKHGTVDIGQALGRLPDLYEYVLVPNIDYNQKERTLTILSYSLVHINNVEPYLEELASFTSLPYSCRNAEMPHEHYQIGDVLSMQFKLPSTNDLDEWLTNLPEDYLQRLTRATDQVLQDNVQDQEALTHITALILHFCGKPALRVEEIMDLFPKFALLLALEILLRQGTVTKQGKYSIIEGEVSATFATVKGENADKNQ